MNKYVTLAMSGFRCERVLFVEFYFQQVLVVYLRQDFRIGTSLEFLSFDIKGELRSFNVSILATHPIL
jgi:hypothetical protein